MPSLKLGILAAAGLVWASSAAAQGTVDRPWSAEVRIGWDNGVSGNVVSSAIGTFQGYPAVIKSRSYDEIYGTGIRLSFGAAYALRERHEVTGTFEYSTVSSDLVELGELSGATLWGDFDDYSVWGIDVGYRYYFLPPVNAPKFTPYVGGSIGVNVINEIGASLAAPDIGVTGTATDLYDRSGAITFGASFGSLYSINDKVSLNAQLGLRYVGGLAAPDNLVGTGLEDINADSGRWIVPFTVGVRFRF
jgi:hypothetical protein